MTTPQLRYLFINPLTENTLTTADAGSTDMMVTYNPAYRLGWRGPYVVANNGSVYTINAAAGFLEQYGENGDPAVLDGWGNPIVIQNPGLDAPTAVRTCVWSRPVPTASWTSIPRFPPRPCWHTPSLAGDDIWFRLNCDKDMIQRSGMTLVELLVVLAILALLTTVAVTSSDVVLSQGRYEATKRTLTDIQEAVLGPPNARQADGTLISMGFVADVGRSPV